MDNIGHHSSFVSSAACMDGWMNGLMDGGMSSLSSSHDQVSSALSNILPPHPKKLYTNEDVPTRML